MFGKWITRNPNYEAERDIAYPSGTKVYMGIKSRFFGAPVAIYYDPFMDDPRLEQPPYHKITEQAALAFVENMEATAPHLLDKRIEARKDQYELAKDVVAKFKALKIA